MEVAAGAMITMLLAIRPVVLPNPAGRNAPSRCRCAGRARETRLI
jgi:hypothetical protein